MSYNWIVSFNDGQRLSSKDLINGDGINPWDKVLNYLRKNPDNANGNNKKITHLQVVVNGIWYNSPTSSKKSGFSSCEFDSFRIFYKDSAILSGGVESDHYVSYSYRSGDYRHFLWINTENNFCYSQIINVINPRTREEREFAETEKNITASYS